MAFAGGFMLVKEAAAAGEAGTAVSAMITINRVDKARVIGCIFLLDIFDPEIGKDRGYHEGCDLALPCLLAEYIGYASVMVENWIGLLDSRQFPLFFYPFTGTWVLYTQHPNRFAWKLALRLLVRSVVYSSGRDKLYYK